MNRKAERILHLLDELLTYPDLPKRIVEIGCVRFTTEIPSDGFSTVYIARWAISNGYRFVSVDRSEQSINIARHILQEELRQPTIDLVHEDGETFLAQWKEPIACVYLDGPDDPSVILRQLQAAEDQLAYMVIIDDTQKMGSHEFGKGSLVIPYLAAQDWDITHYDTESGYRMTCLRKRKVMNDAERKRMQ